MVKTTHFILILALVSLISCQNQSHQSIQGSGGGGSKRFLPNVTGKSGDILVVTTKERWNGEVGQAFRDIFEQGLYGLPQPESIFDLSFMPVTAFKDLVKSSRNIIVVRINSEYQKPELTVKRDEWAKPQIVVEMKAGSEKALVGALKEQEEKIINIFNQAERNRLMNYYKSYEETAVRKKLVEKHGLGMYFPKGYVIKENKNNFIWITHETPKTSQGVIIYHYDYTNPNTFSKDFLLNKRDRILKNHVPGPKHGTYMTTEYRYEPKFEEITYKGRYFAHIKGLWRVEGYFMGGPFISYTTLDEANNRVVTVEGYVYAPRNNKREMLRQLKAIIFTLYFKDDSEGEAMKK